MIDVAKLGKCYRVYARPQDRLWQSLSARAWAWTPRQWRQATPPRYYEEFWALRGIDFKISAGESVGILGRNGAGKSTLLQLLAGTLTPTEGSAKVNGRTAALLELGSGFNPEYTGRENVFMNASILGLTEAETLDRLDDILSFADLGEFINQPVKTYSSGMVMRLAFAVQSAVEPDVLIIDEALSVGDIFFQARCMTRMRELIDNGVTVLFVSHDVSSIRQFCHRAIFLDAGQLVLDGDTASVCDHYVRQDMAKRNEAWAKRAQPSREMTEEAPNTNQTERLERAPTERSLEWPSEEVLASYATVVEAIRTGIGGIRLIYLDIRDLNGNRGPFGYADSVTVRQYIHCDRSMKDVNVVFKIRTIAGTDVTFMDTRLAGAMDLEFISGHSYCFEWQMQLPLLHGKYLIGSYLAHPAGTVGADWIFLDVVTHASEFSMLPRREGMIDGLVVLPARLDVSDSYTGPIRTALGG